jgi:DNA (cytosine-5)-methyltransferase 1
VRLISLFDGIGGFPLAWCNVTGQSPAKLVYHSSEIEPWPMAVVRERFPNVVEVGSVTDIQVDQLRGIQSGKLRGDGDGGGKEGCEDADCILTFGSPCQDLSVAGKRAGLAGERSGLFHEAIRLIRDVRPRYAIWENVAGAFSSNDGEDFAAVVRAVADIGYDACWTTIDAQWFGVPQRRRRVFLVLVRDGIPAGSDLFAFGRRSTDGCRSSVQSVRDSRSGHPAQGGEARQAVAGGAEESTLGSFWNGEQVTSCIGTSFNDQRMPDKNQLPYVQQQATVRRLTPIECLRLMGYPDNWFDGVPGYSDTKAYKAIGNSVAIPCVEWVFRRLLDFDRERTTQEAK